MVEDIFRCFALLTVFVYCAILAGLSAASFGIFMEERRKMRQFWECPKCRKLNFSKDAECFLCKNEKPGLVHISQPIAQNMKDLENEKNKKD